MLGTCAKRRTEGGAPAGAVVESAMALVRDRVEPAAFLGAESVPVLHGRGDLAGIGVLHRPEERHHLLAEVGRERGAADGEFRGGEPALLEAGVELGGKRGGDLRPFCGRHLETQRVRALDALAVPVHGIRVGTEFRVAQDRAGGRAGSPAVALVHPHGAAERAGHDHEEMVLRDGGDEAETVRRDALFRHCSSLPVSASSPRSSFLTSTYRRKSAPVAKCRRL